ncbi:MAG TPA: Ig-like domain-containing protein, partial [Candidatus Glassbacteria bacterium]|nr:Ig-like domain-containing protein [Candidatus Glassbacteria bacterium]
MLLIPAACARMGSPPGGPEDKEPPAVEATTPAPDSTGVALDCRPLIVFSEKVRRETAEPLLRVSPPVGRLFFDWDGRRVRIRSAEGLRPEMTYRLSVAVGLEDLHRAKSVKKYESWFSTGSSFAPGRISGRLTMNDSAAVGGLVEARSLIDSLLVFDTEADSGGRYSFPYLPVGGYRLTAW